MKLYPKKVENARVFAFYFSAARSITRFSRTPKNTKIYTKIQYKAKVILEKYYIYGILYSVYLYIII